MYIAIPLNSNDFKNATISNMTEAKAWALIDFDEGVVKSIKEIPSWQEHGTDWLDFVVLENKYENIMDFMNEGTTVLIRREGQDSVDNIIEAFKFKELDEAGF